MYAKEIQLKPLSSVQLAAEETKILKWLRYTAWEEVKGERETSYRTKVPEFYNGVRLYRVQAVGASAGSLGALELLIKKLGFQGVIGKQDMYPITGHGTQPRYLSLKKPDLDNLGVGGEEDDDE